MLPRNLRFTKFLICLVALAEMGGILAQELPNIPRHAISREKSFVLAQNGQALLYNYDAGVVAAPLLPNVYKSFGFSFDSRYFLYLKANGAFPTFDLYCRDMTTGTEKRISQASVHHAAWSPTRLQLAYISLDTSNQYHVWFYDLAKGSETEIEKGRLRPTFLTWSPDGSQILYISVTPNGPPGHAGFESYAFDLHVYAVAQASKHVISGVDWAQYVNDELMVHGDGAGRQHRRVPNPQKENIHAFAASSGHIYANVIEDGHGVVKRWNSESGTYDVAESGDLYLTNDDGVVIRQITGSAIQYKYLSNQAQQATGLTQASSNWKMPFAGKADFVQGGSLYSNGSCDGAVCLVTAHVGALGYALDWQQVPETNEGNTHVIATDAGTVVTMMNTVTCNSATPSCAIGYDNYANPCNDPNGGLANFVSIAHLDGSYSFYGHLKSGSVQVTANQNVSQGTYLADQGHSGVAATYNTYRTCGDHLHFTRQIAPAPWEQSIPTDFNELPCALSCTSTYTSANVEIAPPPTLATVQPPSEFAGSTIQVSLSGNSFVYGAGVNISGTGVTVSNVLLASSTRITATLTIAAGATAGTRNITVVTPNGTSNAVAFTVNGSASGGSLTGTVATPPASQSLSNQGTTDWAHWGLTAPSDFNHKAGVASQISNYTVIGSAIAYQYTGSPSGFSWTGGTPTSSSGVTKTGIYVTGQNGGFEITAAADTASRTLRLYVGASGAQGKIVAHLSDDSAPDYVDTSLNNGSGATVGLYTLTYKAASAGQTLTVTYIQNNNTSGNVFLQAATMTGGTITPDFSLAASPAAPSLAAGSTTPVTVTVAALNGFSGAVSLAVSGLPAGVTGNFNPASISTSGSSTLTLSATSGAAPGSYPLTVTASSGSLSHTAPLTLNLTGPADFSIASAPATQTSTPGGGTTFTANVTAVNGFNGVVSFSASGLPAGVTVTFKPGTVTGSGSSTMSVSVGGGVAAGSYPISITAASGSISHNTNVTLNVTTAAGAGVLSGSYAVTPSGTVNLTAEGALDWAHWGLSSVSSFDHKAAVTSQISNFTSSGSTAYQFSNNPLGYTWTDGTPTASANNTTTGVFTGQPGAFSITVPADTTPKRLRLYAGAYDAQANITAHLSDNSAADYSDNSLFSNNGTVLGVFTIDFRAASSGQTLTVTLTDTLSGGGNVTLEAATLASGNSTPDYNISASPATVTVAAGNNASYTTTVTALNGFSGSVALSISGLPVGASASFNPTSVAGSGSSALSVTVGSGVASGTYPLTITGTSGTLVHTTNVTLIVAPVGAGSLTGVLATPSGTQQLTTQGTLDWAHWGISSPSSFDHKTAVTQQISNYTAVGNGTVAQYGNDPIGFTWTDGTPTSSATNTTTGIYVAGVNNGFRITAPADTTTRTLQVYVGVWSAQGTIVAHLSDGSAVDYTDSTLNNSTDTTNGLYTFNYRAASSGQTLSITFTTAQQYNQWGNVTLQAATLALPAGPDFSLAASPSTQSAAAGGSATYTATVTPVNGFNGTVTLSASGLPTGVTASFSPATVAGSGSSTATITVGSGVAAGSYPLTITGTSGSLTHSANVTLTVPAADFSIAATPSTQTAGPGGGTTYTATITPLNGFSGTVTLSASGLPTGVTASFSPATVAGSGSSTATITVGSGVAAGTYTLTLTGTSGSLTHSANVSLTVTPAPDFSISASPSTQTVAVGGSTTYTATLTAVNGFSGTITMSASGLPAGVTASFNPATVVGSGSSTATITVGSGVAAGTYTLTLTGTSGSLTHSANVTLTVTPPPDFTIAASPSTQSAPVGGSTTYTATLTAVNGFSGTVTLSASGLPTGVTASFNPATVAGGGSSTATITVASSVATGTYPLTITGTSGSLTHSANVSLTVTPPPDFTIAASPSTQSAPVGGSTTYTATLTAVNGFSGTVTLSASGLPAGVTASFNPATVAGSGSSTATITVASSVATGTYPLTITGTSGSLTHSANVSLNVTDFTIAASPSTQTVAAGGSTTYTATLTAVNGFSGTVTLSASGLPTGVTASFNPATVAGSGSSTATITVASSVAAGTYTLTLTGTSGSLTHSANVSLTVTPPPDFTIAASPSTQSAPVGGSTTYTTTLTAVNGFSGTVTLSASGLPAGVTASFNPATVAGSGSSTATITVGSGVAAGTYTLTLTGTSGSLTHSASVSLTVTDFTIAASPSTQTVAAGGSTTYTTTLTAVNGFSGTVTLSASGLPAGVTASFNPATVTGSGPSTATITVGSGVAAGTYTLTLTGTSGSLAHSANVSLTVTPAPDFTIAASPSTQTVAAGGSTTYTATITAKNGFSGTVTLSAAGLPAGATAAFNPATVAASGSSTATITVGSGVAAGTYPLTITGTSGSLTHSAGVTLTVFAAGSGALTGAVATPSGVQQLTTQGTTDWTHWGLTSPGSFDRKNAVTPQISNYALVGSGTVLQFGNNPAGFTWTDGTPTSSATNTTTGIYVAGLNSGFRITAPADTTVRTLQVYVGVYLAQGTMVAHLSDGSAADYTDSSLNNSTDTSIGMYTFNYKAATSGQTLTVTFTATQQYNSQFGNVTLQAATMSGGAAPADFTLAATPSTQTVPAGGSGSYTLNIGGVNGFSGSVSFSVSGLPAGVTAAFSPTTVTGSGSTTMTLTALSSAAAGSYPLTVTAASGTLSHTANVTMALTAAGTTGSLAGSIATPAAGIQLTTEGAIDWAHWGTTAASSFDHKSGVSSQISNYTAVGSGTIAQFGNNPVGFTWTDGTPTASATNTTTGIYVAGVNNGFKITVPADTSVRTLKVYVGVWSAAGKIVAHLSDGSAPDYTDSSLNNSSNTSVGVYTLRYNAGSSGKTLTITFTTTQQYNQWGNVTLQAASLAP
jgi:uncharacterized membrane protein